MAQAADTHKIPPRSISFKGTLQTLEAFNPLIAYHDGRGSDHRDMLYQQLLEAIVVHGLPIDRIVSNRVQEKEIPENLTCL